MEQQLNRPRASSSPPGAQPAGRRHDEARRTDRPVKPVQGAFHTRTILHVVFFISGFCALIYQTAWQRMLGLFGGSDIVSTTLVVGAFLFGLGIGSLAAASFVDRLPRASAVAAFGLCELGIALYAALSPWLLHDVIPARLHGFAGSTSFVFAVAFAALLPPTLLMGLSLPLLARAAVRGVEDAAVRIGWLYGVNTLGAGLGALLAGLALIGSFGYVAAVHLGALLNAAVGVASLLVSVNLVADPGTERSADNAAFVEPGAGRGLLGWSALLFASGFLIISLEIVWFRILGTMLWTVAYAFPMILAVFLVADAIGIVVGVHLVRRIDRPLPLFLRLQGVVGLYALCTMLLIWRLYALPAVAGLFIAPDPEVGLLATGSAALIWVGIVCVTVAPPAFLLGMSFPIAQKAVQLDVSMVGRRVGIVQLANILGNTTGAVVTGLVLLHWFGTSGTLFGIGLLGLGMLLLVFTPGRGPGSRYDLALAAALFAAVALLPSNAAFWARLHNTVATRAPGGATVVEDRSGIVVIRPSGDSLWMYIAGQTQSRVPFLPFHGTLGAVGPLLHRDPRTVLVIGHAMGGTPYAAALAMGSRPGARVRSIEIVAPVHQALGAHATRDDTPPALRAMLADARIERILGDGRHAVFADPARWDVIEADALLPRSAHSGLLYSVEFFQQVRGRLSPGGIAVQWGPTPRTQASFLSAFPWVLQLQGRGPRSTILLGSADGPISYDLTALTARLASVEPDFAAAGWDTRTLRTLLTEVSVRSWGPNDRRPEDVNTDLFPKDEYFLNKPIRLLERDTGAR